MAKFFYRSDGSCLAFARDAEMEVRVRLNADNPEAAGPAFEFDETTNVSLCNDIAANSPRYSCSGGLLRKDGSVVAVAANSAAKDEREDFSSSLSTMVTRLTQISTQAETGFQNNTARDTAIRDLALALRRVVRRLGHFNSLKG